MKRKCPDALVAIVDGQVSALMEHFDSVQVVATRHDEDGSLLVSRGGGNYYSRIGGVREWLLRETAAVAREKDE